MLHTKWNDDTVVQTRTDMCSHFCPRLVWVTAVRRALTLSLYCCRFLSLGLAINASNSKYSFNMSMRLWEWSRISCPHRRQYEHVATSSVCQNLHHWPKVFLHEPPWPLHSLSCCQRLSVASQSIPDLYGFFYCWCVRPKAQPPIGAPPAGQLRIFITGVSGRQAEFTVLIIWLIWNVVERYLSCDKELSTCIFDSLRSFNIFLCSPIHGNWMIIDNAASGIYRIAAVPSNHEGIMSINSWFQVTDYNNVENTMLPL